MGMILYLNMIEGAKAVKQNFQRAWQMVKVDG